MPEFPFTDLYIFLKDFNFWFVNGTFSFKFLFNIKFPDDGISLLSELFFFHLEGNNLSVGADIAAGDILSTIHKK